MPEDEELSIEERIEKTRLTQAVNIRTSSVSLMNTWDCHRDEHEGITDENIKEHVEECLGEMLNAYIGDKRNYVLNGAVISCDQMTDKEVFVQYTEKGSKISINGKKPVLSDYQKPADIGSERYNFDWEEYIIPSHVGEENIRKLHAFGNSQSDNGICFATVADRSYLREEKKKLGQKSDTTSKGTKAVGAGKNAVAADKVNSVSIVSCGNCNKLDKEDLKKIAENWEDVYKYGTCYALMQLASSWKNPYCMESVVGECKREEFLLPSSGADIVSHMLEYATCAIEHHRPIRFSTSKGEKEGLTMMSTLLCSGKGGIITIEASGQIYADPLSVDEEISEIEDGEIGINNVNTDGTLNKEEIVFIATIYAEGTTYSEETRQAVAHVIMNRVGVREWRDYDSVTKVIEHSGFDAYGGRLYSEAVEYLKNRDYSNVEIESVIDVVLPVYRGEKEDITDNAVLFYSPNAQAQLNKKNPSKYKNPPSFVNDKVEEVNISGTEKDDIKFYKYKD